MLLKKYYRVLKRRQAGRRFRLVRERVALLGRLFQHHWRLKSACVTQGVRKYPFLSYLALMAVKARSEKKEVVEVSRMGWSNLQLLFENQCIVEQNERLRKQAALLSEENRLLQWKLQQQVRRPDEVLES